MRAPALLHADKGEYSVKPLVIKPGQHSEGVRPLEHMAADRDPTFSSSYSSQNPIPDLLPKLPAHPGRWLFFCAW